MQHILFVADLAGAVVEGSLLRHQAEDWEYDAAFLYDFTAPLQWQVRDLRGQTGHWVRRITNLDDGLRYQCASKWNLGTRFPEWSCAENYAPIPGRESRDMGRRDYNTLLRSTRLIVYDGSWLERQENTKTIHDVAQGTRTPLARELGKNWYVKLPDSECTAAVTFASSRRAFWEVLRETWEEVLVGDRPFVEKAPSADQPPRFVAVRRLEEKYAALNLTDSEVRRAAKAEILKVISAYREN